MKRATIRDVARRANLSVGIVSNYLNRTRYIAPDTAERIRAAIDGLHFVPNAGVRVMRGGRSHAMAFIVPDMANPFLVDVVRGIEDVAVLAGDVVITCNTHGSELRVRGAVVITVHEEALLVPLAESGAAVVVPGAADPSFCSVSLDNAHAGYLVGRHLLARGYRDIAFLGGPSVNRAVEDRVRGMRRAVCEAGGDPTAIRRVDAIADDTAARVAAARQVLADPSPAAVFCANDLLAIALEGVLLRAGRRVPADVAVVGFDDIVDAALAPVPLTTVRQPATSWGGPRLTSSGASRQARSTCSCTTSCPS